MNRLAQTIQKSETNISHESEVRARASRREQTTSNSPTSFRFPPDTLAMLEDLREVGKKRHGKIPSATSVLKGLIAAAHNEAVEEGLIEPLPLK